MVGKRHTDVEAKSQYREAVALLESGMTIVQACQQLAISVATFHRWRRKFGGQTSGPFTQPAEMKPLETSRVRQLERENIQLKFLVAELVLENALLKGGLKDDLLSSQYTR